MAVRHRPRPPPVRVRRTFGGGPDAQLRGEPVDLTAMDLSTVPPPLLRDLAEALWAERHAAEDVLHELTTTRLLLRAGEHRFLVRATDQLHSATLRLRSLEVARAAAADQVVDAAGGTAGRDLALRELVHGTAGPWPRVFGDLRLELGDLLEGIVTTTEVSRAFASRGLARVRAELAPDGPSSVTEGRAVAGDGGSLVLTLPEARDRIDTESPARMDLRIQEVGFEVVLDALDSTTPASLLGLLT